MSNESQPAECESISYKDQKNSADYKWLQILMSVFTTLLHADTCWYNCKYQPQIVRPNCFHKSC